MIKSKIYKKIKFKNLKYKKKVFIKRKTRHFFYKSFFNKILNLLTISGKKSIAYSFYKKLFVSFYNSTQMSFFYALILLCKKEKIPFRLLGIRKRGKVLGVPVVIKYFSQYADTFRNLLLFSKKFDKGCYNYLSSFFAENFKFTNRDLNFKKMHVFKNASASLRFSSFKVRSQKSMRYRW